MKHFLTLLLSVVLLSSCNEALTSQNDSSEWSLKKTIADRFLIGTALNASQYSGEDSLGIDLICRHFNAVTPENCMKCEVIHPEKERFDFAPGDSLVDFATANDLTITGHCLIWHSQIAPWFFLNPDGSQVNAEELRRRMEEHITTIMHHYKGRIRGWDVVNEAFEDDGTYRQSKFYEILGEEYIPLAFEYAHHADPDAELYYNDYGMNLPARREAVVKLIHQLKERHLRIDAVGMQGHMGMDYPDIRDFETSINAFADAGVQVMVTEWDMSVLPTLTRSANVGEMVDFNQTQDIFNPYPDELPDSLSRAWNNRMMEFFQLFLRHSDVISRVTTWGVSDGDSWRNYFPREGRVDYPLLFDRSHNPKPFVRELCCPKLATFSDFSYAALEDDAPSTDSIPSNPIIPGCHPDPSICRVDSDYYLVNSSFVFYPGIPIWHSTDLINWTQLGYVLNRPELDPIRDHTRVSGGIYAPDIKYNPADGLFYVIVTDVDGAGTFYVTSPDPKSGNWSERHLLPDVGGIDPSFLFDSDHHAYIVNNDAPPMEFYPGHRAIYVREFDYAKGTTGPAHLIINAGIDPSKQPIWIEGPHLYHIGSLYYLMAAEGGTGIDHSEVIFRSDSPLGPFTPCDINPILTQRHLPADRPNPVTCTGHADLVSTPEGDWYAVFLGVRPYRDDHDVMGRETFLLPVSWVDNQPVILPDSAVLSYTPHPIPPTPLWSPAGLDLTAQFIRTPWEQYYNIDAQNRLHLAARSPRLSDDLQPSVIGRWVTSNNIQAEVTVTFSATDDSDFAGLTLFYDDTHYVRFGKTADAAGTPHVALIKYDTEEILIASDLLLVDGEAYDGPIYLRITSDNQVSYHFFYKTQPTSDWLPLGIPVSADLLSTKTGGAFTGTLLGVYATANYSH